MPPEALRKLRGDILAHGQRVPCILWRGQLLDGRNRWRACQDAGITPSTVEHEGDEVSAIELVQSLNLERRDLTEAQRATAVVRTEAALGVAREARERQRAAGAAQGQHGASGGRPTSSGPDVRRKPLRDQVIPKGLCAQTTVTPQVAAAPAAQGARRRQDEAARSRAIISAKTQVSERAIRAAQAVCRAPTALEAVTSGLVPKIGTAAKIAALPEPQQQEVTRLIRTGEARSPVAAITQVTREADRSERAAKVAARPATSGHVIICGDAVGELRRLPSGSAHCCVTDPPYGLDVHRTRGGGQDYADGEDYALKLLDEVCGELKRVLTADAHLYVLSGYSLVEKFKNILRSHFGSGVQDNPIIWAKPNHTMCDFSRWYASSYELILFVRRSDARTLSSTCSRDIITTDRSGAAKHHSAAKPQPLLRYLIENSTVPGETVIDPFAGSGASIVAAKSTGRRGIGIELDPAYAEAASGDIR